MALVPSTSVGGGAVTGGAVTLFDSTLGADTANIDTGAAGVAQTSSIIAIYLMLRTDDAGGVIAVDITLNNDNSALYDLQLLRGVNASAGASNGLAATKWSIDAHGSGGSANFFSTTVITIPAYTGTTFNKQATIDLALNDGVAAANNESMKIAAAYRSLTPISRVKVAAQAAANLKSGSRMLIIGIG